MARNTTLSGFQQMQRGELEASGDLQPSNGHATEIDPITGDLVTGRAADDEAADKLRGIGAGSLTALGIERLCTAEMSLHMITERVRTAARQLADEPTDADIVAEAERIWNDFSDQRKGPRTYAVDPSGQVRDWRRPDPGPAVDFEPAEPVVHTITDETAQQASLFLVPGESTFSGKDFAESGALFQLGQAIIAKHGILSHLERCQIRYFWKRKTGVSKGERITGGLERSSGLKGYLLGGDFAIWLAADTARERQASDRRVERWLFRQLRRIGQDDKGNFIELPFTLRVFTEEILSYADVGDEDLKVGHSAFKSADQMGLFTASDGDDDDDDEGEDVAGEVIRQLEEDEADDAPADPNAEYDDVLADPAVI